MVPLPLILAKAFQPVSLMLPRNNSVGESLSGQYKSSVALGPGAGQLLSPGAARKTGFGSNTSLHLLSSHSKLRLRAGSPTLTVQAEQRNIQAGLVDRSNSKGYVVETREQRGPTERLLVPQAAIKKDFTNKEKLLYDLKISHT